MQLKALMTPANATKRGKPSQTSQHDFSFLTSATPAKALVVSSSGSAQQPITTNTKFALSQLPTLRSLLKDLRPRLARLQTSITGTDSVRAESAEERREYIEQRTKLHLQRHGDWASINDHDVSGKRVEQQELGALEEVVDILDTH